MKRVIRLFKYVTFAEESLSKSISYLHIISQHSLVELNCRVSLYVQLLYMQLVQEHGREWTKVLLVGVSLLLCVFLLVCSWPSVQRHCKLHYNVLRGIDGDTLLYKKIYLYINKKTSFTCLRLWIFTWNATTLYFLLSDDYYVSMRLPETRRGDWIFYVMCIP